MQRTRFSAHARRIVRILTTSSVLAGAFAVVGIGASTTPVQAVAAAPTVRGIAPATGVVGGGQPVLIWGTGFATSGTISVTVNGVACTGAALALAANATAVKCTTGAGTKGIGNVVVTNPDTQSGTLANAFTYVGAGDNTLLRWGVDTLSSGLEKKRLATAIDTSGALSGLTPVSVSTGTNGCAVESDAKAYCWGNNSSGGLGIGSTDAVLGPVAVSTSGVLSGKSVVQVAAGRDRACAITTEGKAYCWGDNGYGQLGNNSTTASTSPVAVSTGAATSKVLVSLSVGYGGAGEASHNCGVSSDGKAYCWGANASGELGNSSTSQAKTPVAVNTSGSLSGKTVSQVVAGSNFSCALTTEGKVSCWGNNDSGQLGISGGSKTTPQLVGATGDMSGKTLVSISAGNTHACAASSEGKVYCWGYINSLQNWGGAPKVVGATGAMSSETIVAVSSGYDHSCAVAANSKMFCWGENLNWQTGQMQIYAASYGQTVFVDPVQVDAAGALYGKRVLGLDAGQSNTFSLVTSVGASSAPGVPSRIFGWGYGPALGAALGTDDQSGVVGVYERRDPNGVLTGTTVSKVSGSCLLTAAGTVGCSVDSGSLTAIDQTGVLAGKTITALSAGQLSSFGGTPYGGTACVLTSDSGVYCWWRNNFGQLGDGTTTSSLVPVAVDTSGVLAGKTITKVSVGGYNVCVLTSDDGIYCWGYGLNGGLGNGGTTSSSVPVAVDLSGVLNGKSFSEIGAGGTSCVLDTAGEVYCWGANYSGELGAGSADNYSATPVAVDTSGVLDGKVVTAIAVNSHVCVLASDHGLYCWGGGSNGELGNGASVKSNVPVAVDMTGVLAGKTVTQVSTSSNHTCAVDTEGGVYCWGQNQYRQTGQLSNFPYPNTPVEVDTYGVKIASVEALYTYSVALTLAVEGGDPAPVVSSVSPDSGLSLGGTSITISGLNFATSGTVGVTVGGVACTGVSVTSDTEITCTTPAHAGGAVNVVVTNPDNKSGTGTNAFTYIGPPTVTLVAPSAGPIEGGTNVTITGTGFLAGAAVTVGGAACTDVSVDSATSITCTTPAGTAGAADVVVTNSDTQTGTGTGAFTYGNAVTSVTPAGGGVAGGTSVAIAGTGFEAGATVTVGGVACTSISVVSATSITCTTPAGSAGLVDVVVTNPGPVDITGTDLFEYVATPTVTSLDPATGPLAGGTAVAITGTNFSTTGTVTVTVGGATCTDVEVVSATEIGCNTPSGSAGAKDVVVNNPYSVSGTGVGKFTYVAAPTVTSVSPATVSSAGGTSIEITGTAFATVGTVKVTVDGDDCTSVVVSSATKITCAAPAHAVGVVDVTVENPDGQKGTGTSVLTYAAAPTITSVVPEVGPLAGSTSITVNGTGFDTVGTVTVTVGGNTCTSVSVTSATALTCSTPSGSVGSKSVVVTNPSTLSGTAAAGFRYVPTPTVASLDRTVLPVIGGNQIRITGTGFDTDYPGVKVLVGDRECTRAAALSATQAVCTVPAGSSTGLRDVTVTNLAITASNTLANGLRYEDPLTLLASFFPPPNPTYSKLVADVNKIVDAKGNCSNDVNKFNKNVLDQVAAKTITKEQGQILTSFYVSLCAAQLNPPKPKVPVRQHVFRASVEVLDADPVPACSVDFTAPSTSLDFLSPDTAITQYSFSRTDFEFAALWVRVGEGDWSLAVGLDPANNDGTGIDWSTNFVRSLLYLAGVGTLTSSETLNLQFAVGTGGTSDPYDQDAVVCNQTLSIFIGTLPETGSNAAGPLQAALWVTLAGLGLAIVGRRRRRIA